MIPLRTSRIFEQTVQNRIEQRAVGIAYLTTTRFLLVLRVVDEDGPSAGAVVVGVLFQSVHNVLGDGAEGIIHVSVHFRRCLKELDAVFSSQGLALLVGNFSLGSINVAFVANKDTSDVLRSVLVNLPHPIANVCETLLISNVVHKKNAHGPAIICGCDCSETLLASSVPNLQFHLGIAAHYGLDLEIDANRRNKGGCERIIRVSQEKA
mmetsp:Transcript_25114/g.51071  ORF Transcript_25114/g.51071 Transcript_25114/m.51071 type:complete len:209 (+) Transcript_25114:97-723(+)